jgi:hypothetical protein
MDSFREPPHNYRYVTERAPFWVSETFGCLASSAMGACGRQWSAPRSGFQKLLGAWPVVQWVHVGLARADRAPWSIWDGGQLDLFGSVR